MPLSELPLSELDRAHQSRGEGDDFISVDGSTGIVYGSLGLNRDDDLSPGANWLVRELLSGDRELGEEVDYIRWRAGNDNIDLQAAMDELESHSLLVIRKPGWINLSKVIRS